METFEEWLKSTERTPDVVAKWEQLHGNSSFLVYIIEGETFEAETFHGFPTLQDLIETTNCNAVNR